MGSGLSDRCSGEIPPLLSSLSFSLCPYHRHFSDYYSLAFCVLFIDVLILLWHLFFFNLEKTTTSKNVAIFYCALVFQDLLVDGVRKCDGVFRVISLKSLSLSLIFEGVYFHLLLFILQFDQHYKACIKIHVPSGF